MRYFIDEERRLVRTGDITDKFHQPWREVTSQEYDEFRAETRKIKGKALTELKARRACNGTSGN